jgi:ribosomal protein S18 acetylase RimI-like enzyme
MAIEIGEGRPLEPETLRNLYEHAPWARGRAVEDIEFMLKNTDFHFSAWDRDKLVGFARVLTDRIYRATLWDVVVHPDYQKKGVGEALMSAILSHPVLGSVEKFWLNTRDKFGFYEKFGFSRSQEGMVRARPGTAGK